MLPGKAIAKSAEDLFERRDFSAQLARFLCLPPAAPSIVVGLEGSWGSGKTSCINMLSEQLEKAEPKPIVIEFNPWLISSLDTVIEGFLLLTFPRGLEQIQSESRSG